MDPSGIASLRLAYSLKDSDPTAEILPQRLMVLLVCFYQSGEWGKL